VNNNNNNNNNTLCVLFFFKALLCFCFSSLASLEVSQRYKNIPKIGVLTVDAKKKPPHARLTKSHQSY
jgi:hypothetical protein